MNYPSMRYHETKPPCTVNSEEEDKALGSGWVDTPAKLSEAGKEWNATLAGGAKPVGAVSAAVSASAVHDAAVPVRQPGPAPVHPHPADGPGGILGVREPSRVSEPAAEPGKPSARK